MTVLEVAIAMSLVALSSLSLLAVAQVSSRLTSLSVYQASVTAIVQGFVEQTKNIPFEQVPLSPPAGTDITSALYPGLYAIPTQKDDATADPLILSPLPVSAAAAVASGGLVAGAVDNVKVYDVNRPGDLTVHIWAWVEDATPSGAAATQQVKTLTLLYSWRVMDGATERTYAGTLKMSRSLVPTY